MAIAEIRPDWTIGTLNLTSGSRNFTTTGSTLVTAAIQAGDEIITASGLTLIIATITGQNAGTLMEPCPAGAAGNGQKLRIRFQPDGSRYNGAAADLINLLGSGNLYELAGITGSANTLPYFTGAGTMDKTALTAFARTLLGRSNGGQVYGDLGTVPSVQLPSDAPREKAFRLGNVLGTVSQSNGIPTGGIIEFGFNVNGMFVRLADGTQVCYNPYLVVDGFRAYQLYQQWTFPALFSNYNTAHFAFLRPSNNASGEATIAADSNVPLSSLGVVNMGAYTFSKVNIAVNRITGAPDFTSGSKLYAHTLSIGRWF